MLILTPTRHCFLPLKPMGGGGLLRKGAAPWKDGRGRYHHHKHGPIVFALGVPSPNLSPRDTWNAMGPIDMRTLALFATCAPLRVGGRSGTADAD